MCSLNDSCSSIRIENSSSCPVLLNVTNSQTPIPVNQTREFMLEALRLPEVSWFVNTVYLSS